MLRPFTYLRDFDAEAAEPDVPAAAPDPRTFPKYSEEDMERRCAELRQEAFEEGRLAGEKSASEAYAAKHDALVIEALDQILEELPQARNALDSILGDTEKQATRALLELLRRLAPHLSKEGALTAAVDLVQEVLKQHRDAPTLVVKAGRLIADPLRRTLQEGKPPVTGLDIVVEPSLSDFAVHLSWDQGAVDFDPDERIAHIGMLIDQIILSRLKPEEPETPKE
ncbi:hypothetical protein GCM10007972_23560 [Iodidimonas muriae]|uniref:Flagellar assembly protein FliH/Type III secretion system HrpE domain-containing protein n=1 Tax=Iodidimonas muriae TaxID=261467 RepID=A0ABQ2LFF5_9PROT|nr:hypothetical protein [Iodidimonas muriae]GER08604.1 hypothetical protein JCM17843_29140 [Kordiimonadales bacterium JCM 17843]GGO15455.1 hypothetical protein GCM10007972_23560 [Iodidimonas muriae]